jgi:hypothetical protein
MARGATIKAETETPRSVFLILVISSIKLSIRVKIFALDVSVRLFELSFLLMIVSLLSFPSDLQLCSTKRGITRQCYNDVYR